MKKNRILLTLVLVLSVVLLSGCTKKDAKLTCTQTSSGVDIEFNVGFKGNTIQTMDFNYDMDLSNYSDTQITAIGKQDFCTTVKNYMSSFKDAFTNCDQDIVDKHLKVNSVLDVNKIVKSYLQKISSPAAAKKELEAEGYKCVIK